MEKLTQQKSRGKLVVLIIFLFLIMPFISAYKDLEVNIEIIPRGIISESYSVVGDIFSYNITLTNRFNEKINDTFFVSLIFPNNQIDPNSNLSYPLLINPNETKSIIPYINRSANNDTHIWPFTTNGEYKVMICSSDQSIRFVKNYIIEENSYKKRIGYYYYNNCFPYYFSAMPQWQYNLFQNESLTAGKVQEANQKLLDLNIDLEKATQSMKYATYIMVFVAIITLFVAYRDYKRKSS